MRTIYFGDPHVQISNLKESEKLLEFVAEQGSENNNLIILGDLLHTHANVRVEVLEFWNRWFCRLNDLFKKIIILVGNHDFIGDFKSNSHSMSVFANSYENVHIISSGYQDGPFGYLPYIHDKKLFIEKANQLCAEGAKVIVCHGELAGVKYESGMEVIDGVKANSINADIIISGHYHSRQRFANVIYPGTARWLTQADKNEPKGLWLVDHDSETGAILKEEFLDTSHVCTPIRSFIYEEGSKYPEIPEGSRASVELIGSSEWVSKQKLHFKGKALISAKITDKQKALNRKAGNNFEHFLSTVYEVDKNVDKDKLIKFMKELEVFCEQRAN